MSRKFHYLLVTLLFFCPSALSAEELVEVYDCNGAKNTQFSVANGSVSIVRAITNEGAVGSATLISFEDPSRTFTSPVELQTAIFKDVPAGSWKVCFSSEAITLQEVSLGDSTVVSSQTATIGALSLLGGAGAIVAAGHGGSRDSTVSTAAISTSSGPTSSASTTQGPSSGVGGSKGVGVQASNPCFIGDDVTAMSPFS